MANRGCINPYQTDLQGVSLQCGVVVKFIQCVTWLQLASVAFWQFVMSLGNRAVMRDRFVVWGQQRSCIILQDLRKIGLGGFLRASGALMVL